MAIWPWKHFLEPFILLYFAFLLAAGDNDIPSTHIPMSWTNNNISTGTITTFYSEFIMRIILLEEPTVADERPVDRSSRVGFACGFLSNLEMKSFFLATGSVNIMTDVYNNTYLSSSEVFWLANRNTPVHENATLQLLSQGDLVLKDANGTLVWSTNTSNMSVAGMKLERGNLILYDYNNRTVWQSFDHPTDTLLPGQKLMAGQKLVARASATDLSEGSLYLTVTSKGVFAFYQSTVPQMYFKFSVYKTKETDEPSYIKYVNGTLALYISSAEPGEPDAVLSKPVDYSLGAYMRFDSEGHFILYEHKFDEPVDLLALQECNYPTICGNYGICLNGQCSCPSGFAPANTSDSQGKSGCTMINPTSCDEAESHTLIMTSNIYYFSYADPDAANLKGIGMKSCREACLRNCSCKAALFRYYYNTSHGDCFILQEVLSLINQPERIYDYQSNAFVKISNEGNSERRSPASASLTRIIAISTVGAFLLVILIIGFCIMILWKKRDTAEDMEDYLGQLSGMPMRFSYEDLKLATGNFQEKIGEGGFGSVFEGTLVSGERIAVKRLDALGQGKKEFLAEVKTIGSIHHVNLVRLIGFCAEKLHRLLAYEFMCNGSLDKWIFRRTPLQPSLDWQTRRSIILDIAKGLAYLHEDCRQRIVHLDIKPQNILMDTNMVAKISDFGLSKFIEKDQSQVVTTMRGTPGYMAPEWFSSVITEKVDVYSFGIVVMEVVCGRKNLDRSQPAECMHLLTLFMEKAEEDRLIDMVDTHSEDMQLHGSEVVEMMRVAIWCLHSDYTKRPSVSMVLKALEGTIDIEASMTGIIRAAEPQAQLGGTTSVLQPLVLSGPR